MILTYVSSGSCGIRNAEREGTECRLCPGIHGKTKISPGKRKTSRDKYQVLLTSRGQDILYNFLICVVAIYKWVWVSLSAGVDAAIKAGANNGHWKIQCVPFDILYLPLYSLQENEMPLYSPYSLLKKDNNNFNLTKGKSWPITQAKFLCKLETLTTIIYLWISQLYNRL